MDYAPAAFKTVFLHLAHKPNNPLIVHCTVGRGKTGVFCALTLSVCGVEDEVIAKEYALTGIGLPMELKQKAVDHLMKNPALKGNEQGVWNLINAK